MGGIAKIGKYTYPCTDNFHKCKLKIDGVDFKTVEHYFQYKKCTNDKDRAKILKCKSAMRAWEVGNTVKIPDDWEDLKVNVMLHGNREKFKQNPEMAKEIANSVGKIECRGSTEFWNKWNSIILEIIRCELNGEVFEPPVDNGQEDYCYRVISDKHETTSLLSETQDIKEHCDKVCGE